MFSVIKGIRVNLFLEPPWYCGFNLHPEKLFLCYFPRVRSNSNNVKRDACIPLKFGKKRFMPCFSKGETVLDLTW